MKKKFVTYFDRMEDIHLNKDVGLAPFYIAKTYNLDLEYITGSKCIEKSFRGYKIIQIKRWISSSYNLFIYIYLLKNINKIDYLMTFHCRTYNLLLGFVYKILNPNGKFYIKLDLGNSDEFQRELKLYKIKDLKLKFFFYFLKYVDLISAERREVYENLYTKGVYGVDIKNKLTNLINGADNYSSEAQKIGKVEEIEKAKENIIMTVGRIGTYQKNNEFFLKSLEELDLKNWQIFIVGPIEKQFKKTIEKFIKSQKLSADKIKFLGNIKSRSEIFRLYSKSKVFVLTSRFEGFANVFPEARFFGNYILSTDVGGTAEIIKDLEHGQVIKTSEDLKDKLVKIINKSIDVNSKNILRNRNEIYWSSLVENNNKIRETFTNEKN